MRTSLKNMAVFCVLALGGVGTTGAAVTEWKSGNFRVTVDEAGLQFHHGKRRFAEVAGFAFNFVPAKISKIEQMDDDGMRLRLSMAEGDGFHENFPSTVDLVISHDANTFRFHAEHPAFNHVTIRMRDLDEHYFGLIEKLYPDNAQSPDLRGETVDVDVYALGEKDYAENYASAYSAFFMSSAGYGSFFDTFARGRYAFAKDGMTEIYHRTGKLDWYLFYGPDGIAIHKEYYRLIGAPKRVPVWAAGPVVWRDHNGGGKDQILDDLRKFSELKIPLTATFVDRPYSRGGHEWSKMDFTEKFANPKDWIAEINRRYGMEFMTWVGPLTFGDTNFPGLLPNYKSYIDLTHPGALAEFKKRLARQYAAGVRGHKMDRADENFPFTALWHEPVSESETRNKYVYLYSKVIHEFLQEAHGDDQFNFARAAYHRSQPYLSAIWGGDSRPNWAGMSGNQANAMRAAFMGFPVWGNDTGGYLGEGYIDEKLYMRWLQWSAWNGLFEIKLDGAGGSGRDRVPWRYSEKLQAVFRQVCERRMELLPYIYSLANTSAENGVLMKPLAYLYPFDEKTYSIWDEYIFGEAFLVAPLFGPQDTRAVYLPAGIWHDYNDPAVSHKGPVTITARATEMAIPVFLRANSIHVTGDIHRGNSRLWQGEVAGRESLTIHLSPGLRNERTEFAYIDYLDADSRKEMTLAHESGGVSFNSPALTLPARIRIRVERRPRELWLNGEAVDYAYNATEKWLAIAVKPGEAIKLTLR